MGALVNIKRRGAGILRLTAAVLSAGALIEVAARLNVRRERQSRAYLGEELFFESIGEGTPLLLLPGFQGSTRYWHSSVPALSEGNRLILVDPLGFGRSPWPDSEYAIDDHLGALRRTMISLQLERPVTILAHSFGCLLAAFYAAAYPDDVEKIILMGAPVFRGPADARKGVASMSPMAALFALHPSLSTESCKMICAFRPLVQALSQWIPSRLPSTVVSDSVLHYWKSVDGTLRNVLFAAPIESALASVRCPVTFLHGTSDRVTPVARIHEAASICHGSVQLTDDDHQSYLARSLAIILRELNRGASRRR